MQTFVGKSDTGCAICLVYFENSAPEKEFFVMRVLRTLTNAPNEVVIEYDYVHLSCALEKMEHSLAKVLKSINDGFGKAVKVKKNL